ncbi:MAG: hypothetical protein ACYDG2_00835 [Ruminiclostridium sp.]
MITQTTNTKMIWVRLRYQGSTATPPMNEQKALALDIVRLMRYKADFAYR